MVLTDPPTYSVPKEYRVLGNWDASGVPKYLQEVTTLPPTLLNRVLTNIPERSNVPKLHPTYFTENVPTSLLIQSEDADFAGAEVFCTFMYEAAGYRNVVGYYVFPLRDGYDVPTKWDGSKYVPMTISDIDAVDENGKSVLYKTIIFPNASLPAWENNNKKNSLAGGGNLLPGSKVKLAYDVENPDTPFPNNTGIGFFVIPNGFSGSGNISNAAARLYSHSHFNPGQFKQVIQLADLSNSDKDKGSFVISFEDITRTSSGCDNDFNDVIVLASYTPITCVKLDNQLQLPDGTAIVNHNIIFDRSGMYYTINDAELANLLAKNNKTYTVELTLTPVGKQHNLEMDQLEDILNKIIYSAGVTVKVHQDEDRKDTDEYYFTESKKYFTISLTVNKANLQSYMYFFNSIANIDNESPIVKNRTVLVDIQAYIVNSIEKFAFSRRVYGTDDSSRETEIKSDDAFEPTRVNLVNPFSMGDPHIQTITGEKFDLPSDEKIYVLYEDSSISIRVKNDAFEFNNNDPQNSHLRFMKLLAITYKDHQLIADLFNRDIYYLDAKLTKRVMAHDFFELLDEQRVAPLSQIRRKLHAAVFKTNQFHLRYVKFVSDTLGTVFIELLFIPHRRDTVNSVSFICENLYAAHLGSGAFVKANTVIAKDSLF